MRHESKQKIVSNYQELLAKHRDGPAVTQNSAEGQVFRFKQIATIANLTNARVLDIGCGIGDFYPFLSSRFAGLTYTGIDIVPEFIEIASIRFPLATFQCKDILADPPTERYDYVFMCGVFNNLIPDINEFIREMVRQAFALCTVGMAFNFISTTVNFRDPEIAYHDPAQMLGFCIRELSPRIRLHHHYQRCDVSVFVDKVDMHDASL